MLLVPSSETVYDQKITSVPGAVGMYGLSIGVAKINETLPRPVYALLSGLNAATVGVIALAAIELSEKAITDRLTRIVVFIGAAAGMLYNALWYFPVLMIVSGAATLIFDFRWLHKPVVGAFRVFSRLGRLLALKPSNQTSRERRSSEEDATAAASSAGQGQELHERHAQIHTQSELPMSQREAKTVGSSPSTDENEPRIIPREMRLDFSWKAGAAIIVCFFASFIAAMVLRSILPLPVPLLYR